MRQRLTPPARLLKGMHGETDRRGFLATHVAFRDEADAPVLKLVDSAKADRCMLERRCQTCGFDLDPGCLIVFVGEQGDIRFKEPPIHLECAFYSIGTCPALVTRERLDDLLVVLCCDYEYQPARQGSGGSCLPVAAEDLDGKLLTPVERTSAELGELLRAGYGVPRASFEGSCERDD